MNNCSKVSIIIPFFNRISMTKDCLKSIFNTTQNSKSSVPFEIILVDDSSEEAGSFQEETEQYLNIKILRNDQNMGFARSCNRGASVADSKYLLFLNNDTIAIENWLSNLLQVFETESDVGICGSKLLYQDDTIQHAGVVFDDNKQPFHIYYRFPSSFPGADKIRDFQAVTAACLMIEADLFYQVGGFDESYLNGFEDVDLCFKVREVGRRVVYTPLSSLYHLESQTRKSGGSKQAANLNLFMGRWGHKVKPDFRQYYQEDLLNDKEFPPFINKLINLKKADAKTAIAVWGAGSAGRHMVDLLRFVGIIPDFLVDNDPKKWGSHAYGSLINSPDFLKELRIKGQPVFTVIASLYFNEIKSELEQLGFKIETDFFC